MKPLIKENLRERVYFFSLLYLAISIPFQFIWFPPTIGMISLMLAWIFSFNFTNKWAFLKNNLNFKLVFALYCLSLAGMVYTSNSIEGWKDVTVKISLLFFPLALASVPPISKKSLGIIMNTFVNTMAIAILYLLSVATIKYFNTGSSDHYFYGNFVALKRVPSHYFALYVNLAIFVSLFKLFKKNNSDQPKKYFPQIALIGLLVSALYLCSIRIQFLAFVFILVIFIIHHFRKSLSTPRLIFSITAAVTLLFSVAWLIPESKRRIVETFDEYSAFRGREELKQMNHRVFLWKYGAKVIGDNLWTGTGTGAANDELHEYLVTEKAKFWNGTGTYTLGEKKYNYHNEYLQYFASHGVIGLILLLSICFLPLIKDRPLLDFQSLAFILLMSISFMTESMLERQAGNVFFAFFYALLLINPRNKMIKTS